MQHVKAQEVSKSPQAQVTEIDPVWLAGLFDEASSIRNAQRIINSSAATKPPDFIQQLKDGTTQQADNYNTNFITLRATRILIGLSDCVIDRGGDKILAISLLNQAYGCLFKKGSTRPSLTTDSLDSQIHERLTKLYLNTGQYSESFLHAKLYLMTYARFRRGSSAGKSTSKELQVGMNALRAALDGKDENLISHAGTQLRELYRGAKTTLPYHIRIRAALELVRFADFIEDPKLARIKIDDCLYLLDNFSKRTLKHARQQVGLYLQLAEQQATLSIKVLNAKTLLSGSKAAQETLSKALDAMKAIPKRFGADAKIGQVLAEEFIRVDALVSNLQTKRSK